MSNRLEALRVFVIAANSTNFREAAVKLAVSPQVVSRVIKQLEDDLGEPLFHRNTHGVQLTSFGAQFTEHAKVALTGVDALFHRSSRRKASDLAGTVRITAPAGLGRYKLLQPLAERIAAYPGLLLDMRFSSTIVDVVDQQVDIGLRIGMLKDSNFIAKPVSKVTFHVVAAPSLLKRIGRPDTVDAVLSAPTTVLIDVNSGRPWAWFFKGGRQFVPTAPAYMTDDPLAEEAAVLAGFGIGQLAGHHALPHIRAGRLVSLIEHEAPEPWNLYVYRPRRGPVPARVRLVYDSLVEALSGFEERD
jgi:DNA-binding transcriptional LysR family regulator